MTFTVRIRGTSSALIAAEFECPEHGVFEALCHRDADTHLCPACGAVSDWRISAPMSGRPAFISARRGKNEEKPFPTAMDTEALADGMPMHEWKAQREKIWNDHEYKQWKKERS